MSVLERHTNEEVGCMKVWSEKVKSGDPDNLEARAPLIIGRTFLKYLDLLGSKKESHLIIF